MLEKLLTIASIILGTALVLYCLDCFYSGYVGLAHGIILMVATFLLQTGIRSIIHSGSRRLV